MQPNPNAALYIAVDNFATYLYQKFEIFEELVNAYYKNFSTKFKSKDHIFSEKNANIPINILDKFNLIRIWVEDTQGYITAVDPETFKAPVGPVQITSDEDLCNVIQNVLTILDRMRIDISNVRETYERNERSSPESLTAFELNADLMIESIKILLDSHQSQIDAAIRRHIPTPVNRAKNSNTARNMAIAGGVLIVGCAILFAFRGRQFTMPKALEDLLNRFKFKA